MSQETALERLVVIYGLPLADWIEALARACDATSMTAVADKLDYSRALVSLFVSGKYDRSSKRLEQKVRSRLMGIECPVYGAITSAICREKNALPYSNANAERVQLFRACRKCVHSRTGEKR